MWFRIILLSAVFLVWLGAEPDTEKISIPGLTHSVEIFEDPWGVAHIYAETQSDLFLAQGFNAARDRLFQLELWRRQATGTMSEILGPDALNQDIGARLLKLRSDMQRELRHYHADGEEIIDAFVQGYNAFVGKTEEDPSLLPPEFALLGIKPGRWTPEIVVSRHNGLFRNAGEEIKIAQMLHLIGEEKTRQLLPFSPGSPDLKAAAGLDLGLLTDEVLGLYRDSRKAMRFLPSHILDPLKRASEETARFELFQGFDCYAGSNNWVVSGKHTITGKPFMANDPHRSLQVPSLRYWVHLVAPGWDVIGGGEPALPGVSIGHNAFGAWGLTIFAVDQEDLYVYETNARDPLQYKYRGDWANMEVIWEKIDVKGAQPVVAELKFTRHGPVIYEDRENQRVYALRAAWLERGSSPYLASLRIDQAKNWEEFRDALTYFRTPSENMVWADQKGNIGWQAVGISPIRPNWSGLLPVPGDGRFEWDGYLPIRMLPNISNPQDGFLATANQNNLPEGYPYKVGYLWSDPFRHARLVEFLNQKRRFTLGDMVQLQLDVISIPARSLVPLLKGLSTKDSETQKALNQLLDWNFSMDTQSSAAAIYMLWERSLRKKIYELSVPANASEKIAKESMAKVIDWLTSPDGRFGENPMEGRDDFLLESLKEASAELRRRFGPDIDEWRLGDERLHHALTQHPLSQALKPELRVQLDAGPVPRPGNGSTVNMTTDKDNQSSGGTFRIIADLADWDRSLGSNSPGQSGNPEDGHYQDLLDPWSKGQYFPLYYSRSRIEETARSRTILEPKVQ